MSNPCGVPTGDTRLDHGKRTECAELGHPGVTFNDWLDRTWCLCGEASYPGRPDTVDQHLACCGGPLDRYKPAGCTNPPENQEEGD